MMGNDLLNTRERMNYTLSRVPYSAPFPEGEGIDSHSHSHFCHESSMKIVPHLSKQVP